MFSLHHQHQAPRFSRSTMGDLTDLKSEIKDALESNNTALAVEKIQKYLEEQKVVPVNIAITGESGSGKSTLVNAFRGIDNRDERAAPTGCVETTTEVTSYSHPKHPNVTISDLPGIGTTNFPAARYLEHVGFEKFDFFIIVSSDRFRENDVKLATEIQRMGKKFYFVRTKIDDNMRAEQRTQRDFDEKQTLQRIRNDCIQGLQKLGIESPKVFLVSGFDLHLYDFSSLQQTLASELPAHKRDALVYAMPSISEEIINAKKTALQGLIQYHATAIALVAAIPVPGLSVYTDLAILVNIVQDYKVTFGLDDDAIKNLALSASVSLDDLRAVMKSRLSKEEISTEVIRQLLSQSAENVAVLTIQGIFSFIPLIGMAVTMPLAHKHTTNALYTFLDMLADDAQRVFKRALGVKV